MPALYGAPHGKCRIQSGRKPWRLSLIQQNAQEGERIWVQHGMKHRLQIVCISVYLEKQTAENLHLLMLLLGRRFPSSQMWRERQPIRYTRQWKFIRWDRARLWTRRDSMMKVRWENSAWNGRGLQPKKLIWQLLFSACPVCGESYEEELKWYTWFKERKIPVLLIINKADVADAAPLKNYLKEKTKEDALVVSALTGAGMENVREAMSRRVPENFGNRLITGDLVTEEDLVLLVMPQDIQAPKGRLILPQVQTLRELLDKKCMVMSVTTDKLLPALNMLQQAPKLIITDSQVFDYVYQNKPAESMLTSFSVLFAAYKGDLPYYMEGARQIDAMNENSHVLIAECCTHAPLSEDIGRVKIPRMLRKRFGERLRIDHVSGTDFPQDLEGYDLIIQCGACMFNRRYVVSRIDRAKAQNIPMTNYGITIAHLTGILDKIVLTLR